jgi:hypothetical protein
VKKGDLRATGTGLRCYRTRLDGLLEPDEGSISYFSLRDKTLKISTESKEFEMILTALLLND